MRIISPLRGSQLVPNGSLAKGIERYQLPEEWRKNMAQLDFCITLAILHLIEMWKQHCLGFSREALASSDQGARRYSSSVDILEEFKWADYLSHRRRKIGDPDRMKLLYGRRRIFQFPLSMLTNQRQWYESTQRVLEVIQGYVTYALKEAINVQNDLSDAQEWN